MKRGFLKISLPIVTTILIVVFSVANSMFSFPVLANHDDVTICHATGSQSNPYTKITVDDDAVNGSGSSDHNRGGHQNGEDIIPPGSWDADGRNWDAAHIAIYNNDCNAVSPSPSPSLSPSPSATPTPTPTPSSSASPSPSVSPSPTPTPLVSPSPTPDDECDGVCENTGGNPSPSASPSPTPSPDPTASPSPSTGGGTTNSSASTSSNSGNNTQVAGAVYTPQVLAATGMINVYKMILIGFGMITAGVWQLKRVKKFTDRGLKFKVSK